jgi:shikimate kinase
MGAGKTTTARALARKLSCTMIDLDCLIEEREGRQPQVIIEEDGERQFREIETRALREALAEREARILALGGGAWTIPQNRALIKEERALTIWLDAPFELCWRRIASEQSSGRPLARDKESARRLYDERRELYSQAGVRIKVGEEKSADALAAEIEKALLSQRLEEKIEQGKL